MSATLDFLFDDTAARPKPSLQHAPPAKPTTDIVQWLKQNTPQDYADLQNLRKALYSRRTHDRFVVRCCGETYAGEEKFTVATERSSLLIVSNKSRHYLLRTLCRLFKQS
jgi:hypothetical protein